MLWNINPGYYSWFRKIPANNIHIYEPETGDVYFRAKSTEYFPVLDKKFFSDPLRFNGVSYTPDEIEDNRYISQGSNRMWGSDYELIRYKLIDKVVNFPDTIIIFNERFINFTGGRRLERMSYHRLKKGGGQVINGFQFYSYNGLHLYYRKEDEELKPLMGVYFKTKYLADLQSAILSGKPMKAKWFTLFLAKTLPSEILNKKGNIKAAFHNNILAPFVDKGFEVLQQDNFMFSAGSPYTIENLKDQIKPYSEYPMPVNRAEAKEYKENLFQEFLDNNFDRYNTAFRKEQSKLAEEILEKALEKRVIELCAKKLREMIHEDLYKGVLPEENTVRKLKVAGHSFVEKLSGGLWKVLPDSLGINLDETVQFSTLNNYSRHDSVPMEEYFKLNSTSVTIRFGGYQVAEGDKICSTQLNLYEINSNYHAVQVNNFYGSTLLFGGDNYSYRYVGQTRVYHEYSTFKVPEISYFPPLLNMFDQRELLVVSIQDILDYGVDMTEEKVLYVLENNRYYYLKNNVLALYIGTDYDLSGYLHRTKLTFLRPGYEDRWHLAEELYDYAYNPRGQCLLSESDIVNKYRMTAKVTF